MKNSRGDLLIGNIIFIILNLVFLSILVLFLLRASSSGAMLEESYSKQIALFIDSAQPGMIIELDMEKGFKIAEKNGIALDKIVQKKGNVIKVKLDEEGGHTYSFFNDVDVNFYPREELGLYVLTIDNKGVEENEEIQ